MIRAAFLVPLLLAAACQAEVEQAGEPALNRIAEKNRAAARDGAERLKAESKAARAYPANSAEAETEE